MPSTFVRASCGVAVLAAIAASPRVHANGSLFEAIRRGDVGAVKTQIAAGADIEAGDDTGATPLMCAALYAGPEVLRALIDRGAAVNVANSYGATPLMWAAASAANVKVLVEHGADVNAHARDGVTPLIAATRFDNADAMRVLIAAGANPASPAQRASLLTAAAFAPTDAARRVLADAGVTVRTATDVKGPVLSRYRGDVNELKRLFAAGVSPDEQVPLVTMSLPTFFLAAGNGQVNAMRAFVEAGFDPTMIGPRGWTALMLAAASDAASVPAMQYLLDVGIPINARDADGRTALDWALTRGETAASKFLESKGGRTNANVPAVPVAVAAPRSPVDAVTRAVAKLQPAGPAFNDRTKCNSCHNQNIPGIAITLARRTGIPIDERLAEHSMSVTNRHWTARRESILLGDTIVGGFQPNAQYTLLEMAEDHQPSTVNSDALVLGLASRQNRDGSWSAIADIRPPLAGSPISATALSIRALRAYGPEGRRDELHERVMRAIAFVRQSTPSDTQDQAFKLLALHWAGSAAADLGAERSALIDLQRPDGGWGQLPSLGSDAYATGLALYALHAVGMSTDAAPYRNGVAYLLKTQLEDGTWFVRTRAFGFQQYFETGFPHGRSQFISTAATAWASTALTYVVEDARGHSAERR